MNRQKFLQQPLSSMVLVLMLIGCSTLTSTPTLTPSTATPTLVPPTTVPTLVPPTPTIEPANQYADEYMRIMLDKTERVQELPEDFEKPPAEQGKEYIVFHLIVTEIKDIHITNMLGTRENRATLVVDSGEEYPAYVGRVTGVKFSDPTNITSSSELVEGAQCFFAFEVPKEIQPTLLKLSYSYKQDLEEDDAQSVEIEIDL